VPARKQAVQPGQDLQEDGKEAMNEPYWKSWIQKQIDKAPLETPRKLPKPRPLPARATSGAGRMLTEAERNTHKRITGFEAPPGMTREQYNKVIAKYRRGGGFQ
jgi:hypothetical protein